MNIKHLFSLGVVVAARNVLFDGGTIISFDEEAGGVKVLRNHSVLVKGNTISAIFPSGSGTDLPEDVDVVPVSGKILTPGFIDTHRHLFQSAFKTIASNITMAAYFATLSPYVPNVINRLGPDDIYYGQMMAIRESLGAGVTSIVDHSYGTFDEGTSRASLQASIDSGARIQWCFGLHQIPNNFTIAKQAGVFQQLLRDTDWASTIVRPGISFDEFADAPQSVLDTVINLISKSNLSTLTTHFLGGPWIGANSPKLLKDLGLLNSSTPVIFSHATALTPEDAAVLREYDHHIAIAPESEMHFGHGYPHSHKIMDQAALAIDASWAWSGDIVTQARIWLQSVRVRLYQATLDNWRVPKNNPMSVNQAFLLATRAGAKALRRSDLGVLSVHAKADIVVFDGSAPNMVGWNDPVAAVILHSNPGNVEHVMVDGQFRKRDFKLITPSKTSRSLEDLTERFLKSAERIQSQFLADPPTSLYGEHKPGVPYAQLSNVDVLPGRNTGY
ncbi:hypothetical protein NM208_g1256 [Fusarium decemcellulare]|uniref:Uncharacterized protein n=1 Tax=Fusarium decemcellulare TaxID=57161 RepID=A0ACC1SX05_9HYPO|nr:hypothetical protein NM208_g1256 [Fusarium decemcellulare]